MVIQSYKPALSAQINDVNGYLLTEVYDLITKELKVSLQLNFFNGTPSNELSFSISSTYGYFDTYNENLNVTNFTGSNYNVSLILNRHSISGSTDIILIKINWDGNSYQKTQSIVVNSGSKYSDLLNLQIINPAIFVLNGSTYILNGKISSSMLIPIRNVALSINQSYGFEINPGIINIPIIGSSNSITFSFNFTYSNLKLNLTSLVFLLIFNSPSYQTYSYQFNIKTNSISTSSSQSSGATNQSTSQPTKTTPGFEIYFSLGALILIILKKNKSKMKFK